MDNFYAEQSFLTQQIVTIDEQRQTLNDIVKYFQKTEPGYETMLQFVADKRGLPVGVIRNSDAFFIDDGKPLMSIPEEFRHESYGICRNNRVVYAGRCVYPVKDVKGNVMGFCGWEPSIQPKYLDSKNYGYKAKRNVLYGMEMLPEYYTSTKPVVLVEGLVDCLLLRYLGVQALALLGSMMTGYIVVILKRFGNRLIVMPDNDNYTGDVEGQTSGEGFVKQTFKVLPEARVFQTINFNDLNDCWRGGEEHQEALKQDLANIDNRCYLYKELRQRSKPKWRREWITQNTGSRY